MTRARFTTSVASAATLALGVLSVAPLAAHGYSWQFESTPKQCGTLSLSITGSGGQPPYYAVLVPYDSSPTPKEVRKITTLPFNDTSKLEFQMRFPKDSHFVIVVSDQKQFGSGGTSVVSIVQDGDDGCFDPSQETESLAWLATNPNPQQCKPSRIYWDKSLVKGQPAFYGVIPGGESFPIPNNTISDQTNYGAGFDWKCPVRLSTQMAILGADSRGIGALGSASYTIQQGGDVDNSCLNDNSPSSTPGTPAGGSYPTSTSGAGTGGGNSGNNTGGNNNTSSGGKKTNIGAIIGGVVGGLAVLAAIGLLALFFVRRRRFHKQQKERPVDLLPEDEQDRSDGDVPQYYHPDPFVLPDPSQRAESHHPDEENLLGPAGAGAAGAAFAGADGSSSGRPSGDVRRSSGPSGRPGTPGAESTFAGSSTTRKTAAGPGPLRPVNIIQHDDGGRVPDADKGAAEPEETIELPPAYTNIKRGPSMREPGEAPPPEDDDSSASPSPPMQMPVPQTAEHAPGMPVPELGEGRREAGAAA